MTDQHDASGAWPSIEDLGVNRLEDVPRCLLELRSRIEALEAAQLEQAESHRFCTDAIVWRVEALEAARATRPTPPAPLSETLVAKIQRRCGGGEEAARIAIHEVADWLRWISSISENNDSLFQASLLIRKQADR